MFKKIKLLWKKLLLFNTSEKPIRIENKPVDEFTDVLNVLELLDPSKFKNFNCSKNSYIYFLSLTKNLPLLNSKLQELIANLKLNRKLYATLYSSELTNVNVCTFFLSVDGMYINEVQSIAEFKKLAASYFKICSMLEIGEGFSKYNYLQLTLFNSRLIKMINDMILVSNKSDKVV